MDKFRIWYQLYIDVCNQKYNSCLDGLQTNNQNRDNEEIHQQLSSVREEMDARFLKLSPDKVYKKLRNHPKIEKIEIDNNELNVITKKLKVKGHNIGHFKFTFDPT